MGVNRRTCVVLGLLIVIGTFATARGQDETLPERITFTFPPQMEELAKGLEEAGVHIVYGPNSVPAPEGVSEAAKKVWVNLPQLPLPADDPKKLAAMREMAFLAEDAGFEKFKTEYSLEDREINGITTLWITPPNLKHEDKVMIFIHGGAWILNSRKTQLPLQTAVADSLGAKVVSLEYPLAPEHPYPAALNDIVAAYTGIINEYGAENTSLFGTSAGGGLTLATLLRLKVDGLPLQLPPRRSLPEQT